MVSPGTGLGETREARVIAETPLSPVRTCRMLVERPFALTCTQRRRKQYGSVQCTADYIPLTTHREQGCSVQYRSVQCTADYIPLATHGEQGCSVQYRSVQCTADYISLATHRERGGKIQYVNCLVIGTRLLGEMFAEN